MTVYIKKFEPTMHDSDTSSERNVSLARKYTSPDSVQNNDRGDSVPNIEHTIGFSTDAKSVSLALVALAKRMRRDVTATQKLLDDPTGKFDDLSRSPLTSFSEKDVLSAQNSLVDDASHDFLSFSEKNISAKIGASVDSLVKKVQSSTFPVRSPSGAVDTINDVSVRLDSISLDTDQRHGTINKFFARLVFNVKTDELSKIRAFRVFRAIVPSPNFTRPPSILSSEGVSRLTKGISQKKGGDPQHLQRRFDQNDVANAAAKLNPIDPQTNSRTSSSTLQFFSPSLSSDPPAFVKDLDLPDAIAHLDRSVLQNVNVLSTLTRSKRMGVNFVMSDVTIGNFSRSNERIDDAQQLTLNENSKNDLVVDPSGRLSYTEIAFLSPDRSTSTRVNDLTEFSMIDDTILYGSGYRYFVTTLNENMIQSRRSEIGEIVIEGIRVPPRPRLVTSRIDSSSISLISVCDDALVEKIEVWRRESDLHRNQTSNSQTISTSEGYPVSNKIRSLSTNNFLLIGEALVSRSGFSSFRDVLAVSGKSYTYRVYTVDIFGNKSESPFELDLFVAAGALIRVKLGNPMISAEVDEKTMKMRVIFSCEDPKVEKFFVDRRDLTIGQQTYSAPAQTARIKFGSSVAGHRGAMNTETAPNSAWTGVFGNPGTAQIMIDDSSQFDHIYQYRVCGQDRNGNRTSYEMTQPVMLVRRALIPQPTDLSARLLTGSNSEVLGVSLSWKAGHTDVSAEDMTGSQGSLSDSIVRTLYQIDRRISGSNAWEHFPLMSGTTFQDSVSELVPNSRPKYLKSNLTYVYRIKSLQEPIFVSNFTPEILVSIDSPVAPPSDFVLSSPSVYQRPFFAMLNWKQPAGGPIERWEIERAAVNNFAAARLSMKNPNEFSHLRYESYRIVNPESARFKGKEQDDASGDDRTNSLITGDMCFPDFGVDFGNSYFYRIRALGVDGSVSDWTYRGLKLTSSSYENKWTRSLVDDEKSLLSRTFAPGMLSRGQKKPAESSSSLLPSYFRPSSLDASPRIKPSHQGN